MKQKTVEEYTREDKRVEEKKIDVPLNFYIAYYI